MPFIPADRILLLAMPLIGDVILATPLLRSLRWAYPKSTIDVFVYKSHGAVLKGNPDLDRVIEVVERPKGRELFNLFRRLFRHYDLSLSNSTSDRKILYAVLAARRSLTLVPPARWQDAWKRVLSYGWTELDDRYTHTVVQNLRLADLLGIERCYEVVPPQSQHAARLLDELLPFDRRSQAYAVLHLAPRWHYKRWTSAGWKELADYLARRGLRLVLTGGADKQELEYIRTVTQNMPDTVCNLAAKLGFGEVAKLIADSRVYVGPDTAVTHLAAATGAPTVALFGPTNPLKWSPWPRGYAENRPPFAKVGSGRVNNVFLVQGEGECVPCHEEGCERHKLSASLCLEEMAGATVIRAVDELAGWSSKDGAPSACANANRSDTASPGVS